MVSGMRSILALVVPAAALFLLSSFTKALPVQAEKALRIACYNVENLFDNHDDPYRPDEGTSPKSRADRAVLARTIDKLDADVLGLCEVENREVVLELNAMLAKPYAFVEVVQSNDRRGIDCALLSRVQLRRSTLHRYWPLEGARSFARDLVIHELEVAPGERLLVAPMHFKSKRSGKNDPQSKKWRGAEARAVVEVLREMRARGNNTPFVLLGDLNDTPDAETLAPLFAAMKDASQGIPSADRWSYEWSGKKQQIDYVLYDSGDKELRVRSARFLHDAQSASDHAPLVVEFAWPVAPVRAAAVEIDADENRARGRSDDARRPRVSATDAAALKRNLLREVEASGVVRRVQATRSGGHYNLEFGDKPRSSLTVFVPRKAVPRFPDLESWSGKTLTIRGPVFLYRGRPEIQLTRPAQVEVR